MQPGDLVVGRYSVLPFYRELEADVLARGARLINTARQHEYVADIRNWYHDLARFTPKTWFRLEDVDEPGPFVLKGSINSRKHDWSTHMFAEDKEAAGVVYSRLSRDGLLGRQEIVIRKYVPLVTYGYAIGGLPITKEFRFLMVSFGSWNRSIITAQPYYWDALREDAGLEEDPPISPAILELLERVVDSVADRCCFYAIDIGEDIDGAAHLIELNDGQMSGLSGADPYSFYLTLAATLDIGEKA